MNLLIDTHVALWWFDDPMQLSTDARAAIGDIKNRVYISAATAWEIAIKRGLGKLKAPADLQAAMRANFFEPLAISLDDALRVESLPMHHRDPFDRLLIAQSFERRLTLVSRDAEFGKYSVPLVVA